MTKLFTFHSFEDKLAKTVSTVAEEGMIRSAVDGMVEALMGKVEVGTGIGIIRSTKRGIQTQAMERLQGVQEE